MDHSNMVMSTASMAMSGMTPTATGMGHMPSSTAKPMGGMGGMGMGGGCKISMLWNWYTIDACFISRQWRVTSKGAFAGSCIGVILLVILLEFLRRAGKEYDRFIVAQQRKSLASIGATNSSATPNGDTNKSPASSSAGACSPVAAKFRPTILQQAIRALLHMCQFAVAYFIMLLAMYYNGYIIICIFIGAYLGYFIFGWESFSLGQEGQDRLQEEVTVCCG